MDDNLRKAALLLASIPEADSAALMSRLSADQIETMAKAISQLRAIPTDQQQQLVAELIDRQYRRRQPGDLPTEPSRNSVYGTQTPAEQRELEQLQQAPSQWLAQQLTTELPQTAAVALCHLRPALAAATLACLPTETQIQVVKRIADSQTISPDVVNVIIERLACRLRIGKLAEINRAGGLALVAQIIQRLDRATERALLENLAQDNRALVDQLLKLTFLLRGFSTCNGWGSSMAS
jgi:flagellar motor switch protein FliG